MSPVLRCTCTCAIDMYYPIYILLLDNVTDLIHTCNSLWPTVHVHCVHYIRTCRAMLMAIQCMCTLIQISNSIQPFVHKCTHHLEHNTKGSLQVQLPLAPKTSCLAGWTRSTSFTTTMYSTRTSTVYCRGLVNDTGIYAAYRHMH